MCIRDSIRETELLGDAVRGEEVRDAIRLHVHALDVALADEALQVDVGQTERDAELRRQTALCDARVRLDRLEQPEIAMRFDVDGWPRHTTGAAAPSQKRFC